MKLFVIAIILVLPSVVSADQLSLSGHWQDAAGRKLFLHHQRGNRLDVWVSTSNRQVAFVPGKFRILSATDNITQAALCEIDANSDETLVVRHNGRTCTVKNPNFNLWGLLFQSGFRERYKEFRAVGHVSGTVVCGQDKESWSASYSGSWKRL